MRPDRPDKLYKKIKHCGLEADKDNFKVAKMHFQKMIQKKKKSYFEEELVKTRVKRKEPIKGFKVTRSKFGQSKEIKYLSRER